MIDVIERLFEIAKNVVLIPVGVDELCRNRHWPPLGLTLQAEESVPVAVALPHLRATSALLHDRKPRIFLVRNQCKLLVPTRTAIHFFFGLRSVRGSYHFVKIASSATGVN